MIKLYQIYSLPYSTEALEPFIDTHTLGLHYQKHHKGYLKKLNDLLQKNNYQYQYPMELLKFHIDEFPQESQADILFNLGGVLNHIIYFQSMSSLQQEPNDFLQNKILNKFDSLDNFKKQFKESALKVKGSGYTYLLLDKNNNLLIKNYLNQDSPYFDELIPLLCIDVWEHAYYINYENKRDLYIDNFFEVMDFQYANQVCKVIMENGTMK